MARIGIVVLLLVLSVGAMAGEVLDNEGVVQLHKLGLGDEVVLEKIRSSEARFDVRLEALKRLKDSGVSGAVISEMIRLSRGVAEEQAASAAAARDANDPLADHEPGIYYQDEGGATPVLQLLEPTVYTQAKSGGFLKSALTYGIAKVKSKAVLSGPAAVLRVRSPRPVFYFYFDEKTSSLGGAGLGYFSAATSANEFMLVRTEVKKNSRELVVGQFSAFGAQGGVQEKSIQPFDFEKLRPGVYKVTPRADLAPGEFCFFYAGATPTATYGYSGPSGGGKVFDFGIDAASAETPLP